MGLHVGGKAPDFILPSTTNIEFKLYEQQKGKPCVLFFYPKDFTPGCTREVCGFRDYFDEFIEAGLDIYGISTDTIKTHLEFKKKHDLPFELLSDVKGKVAKLYDAKVQFLNITKRITFVLDGEQKIIYVFNNMFAANEHVTKVLHNLKQTAR